AIGSICRKPSRQTSSYRSVAPPSSACARIAMRRRESLGSSAVAGTRRTARSLLVRSEPSRDVGSPCQFLLLVALLHQRHIECELGVVGWVVADGYDAALGRIRSADLRHPEAVLVKFARRAVGKRDADLDAEVVLAREPSFGHHSVDLLPRCQQLLLLPEHRFSPSGSWCEQPSGRPRAFSVVAPS